jgi:hypothetical protein
MIWACSLFNSHNTCCDLHLVPPESGATGSSSPAIPARRGRSRARGGVPRRIRDRQPARHHPAAHVRAQPAAALCLLARHWLRRHLRRGPGPRAAHPRRAGERLGDRRRPRARAVVDLRLGPRARFLPAHDHRRPRASRVPAGAVRQPDGGLGAVLWPRLLHAGAAVWLPGPSGSARLRRGPRHRALVSGQRWCGRPAGWDGEMARASGRLIGLGRARAWTGID